ncbi:MAG: type ISP restriction/modification enzyme, partial [candidate division WOR-3 bacterium]
MQFDLKSYNKVINLSVITSNKLFQALACGSICDLHFIGDTKCFPLYIYGSDGNRQDNITDWALEQFQNRFQDTTAVPSTQTPTPKHQTPITKQDIFHYIYAVLHNPNYRKKYELNLKWEFPRIPFYKDFWKWANWGETLMKLHIDFESVDKYEL